MYDTVLSSLLLFNVTEINFNFFTSRFRNVSTCNVTKVQGNSFDFFVVDKVLSVHYSNIVFMIKNDHKHSAVVKCYKNEKRYQNEIRALQSLKLEDIAPQLLYISNHCQCIMMSYIGKDLSQWNENIPTRIKYIMSITKKYDIYNVDIHRKQFMTDEQNIIRMLDFERQGNRNIFNANSSESIDGFLSFLKHRLATF